MGGRGRVKRKAVQSADGWTVITHGVEGMSLGKSGAERKSSQDGVGSMPGVVEGLTVDALIKDFKVRQERWEDTQCAKQLRGWLEKRKWSVVDAACIGIGSFSRDWEHRHRSLWQLVLFVSVVEELRGQGLKIQVYAQDPAFTLPDVEFLKALNIDITETVEEHISTKTFVFSPFVDWYILLPVLLKDKSPELYVGNEILDDYTTYAQTENKQKKLEESNEVGQDFLKSREMVKLADFSLHTHALNGMVVYCQEQADEGDAAEIVEAPS